MRPMKIVLKIIFFTLIYSYLLCQENSDYSTAKTFHHNSAQKKIISIPNNIKLKPKVALVLSGGGARGIAQIGVLRKLLNENINIDYIVGTSIGALIGGLYAVGYLPDDMDSILNNTNWNEILSFENEQLRSNLFYDQKVYSDRSLITLRFKNFKLIIPEAVIVGTKFDAFLQKLFWNGIYSTDCDFNNLKVPFRAIATDIATGKSISLKCGNLIKAIRASITLPLIYAPVRIDSLILVDGGLMANIPVEQAFEFNPDIIIAVNTVSQILNPKDLDKPWNIADQVISIQMRYFSNEALKKADYIVEPNIGNHLNTDFSNFKKLIFEGEKATENILNKIKIHLEKILDSNINLLINNIFTKHLSNTQSLTFEIIEDSSITHSVTFNSKDSSIYFFKKVFHNYFHKSNDLQNINLLYDSLNSVISIILNSYSKINDFKIHCTNLSILDSLELILNKYKFLPYNNSISNQISDDIIKNLKNQGFTFARIFKKEFNPQKGILSLTIDDGTIDSIYIEGNQSFREFLIKREVVQEIGKPAKAEKIIASYDNIYSTGLFLDAELQVRPKPDTIGNILYIKVKEKSTQLLSIGGRIDNERYAQIGIDAIQENFLNIGARLSARFAGGLRNQTYSLKFEIPRFFDTYLNFSTDIYYHYNLINKYKNVSGLPINRFERVKTDDIVIQKYGINLSIGLQIEKSGNAFIKLRNENQRFYYYDSTVLPDYYFIHTIEGGLSFDNRDKDDFPTQGRLLQLSLETSLIPELSTIGFSKAKFLYNTIFSFGKSSIIPTAFFGFADKSLPFPESFDLGGQDNFFGLYENDELGRQIVRGSLEYRLKSPYNIIFDTYLSLRYDLGAVWDAPEEIKFSKFKHSVGLTLAFDTPLGPAKFSAGKAFYFLKQPASVVIGPLLFYFRIGLNL